ncbi:bifunctional diaminohydroxyphosphoribosylaminopyrimidine deaminase/5-amino-6-(5-phosphoribosylamino)uracil reductase RibD [Crocosphaera sp. XPORK-15E]|uniref:bifunctional diaminohydroxyphosphoribosylaminopyrimidine deaminase/5-amino-6-(5-phosphoribosylamino)uracil reductase RibD n=1 Tax=Crocosphaera sp. XPORK-15E TaxID=3110247 RepID=UPI002B210D13|nr:bifunctional diaminohydroxyphosphoribosylaminopyrimidine deaminase/5-amino-6-(5-phosphoribosylamino)uracil reductase RibD [Crocosphaera sp. XPORK-15E]MEA5536711.1 bifunctional diaminohydroxyphosphoribosylaminopyrimidine deaminase/5-amino-6-(5-phosphoribosylamino)uracil reductase RibD [Crocosphaera sp. XPORK-15E]
MNQEPFDRKMMQRCLELARQALGCTSPNPLVGSVIVKDGEIVGEGCHPKAGEPHGEIFALRDAGENAAGATVYVNLEPCNHHGRTPPCTEALIAAKVAKVVVGMVDPNPFVSGKGIEKLREAGIEVIVGVEEGACRRLNEAFIHRIIHQQPFGILKYAMTLDGKIATTTGHSAWVTGAASRLMVHQIRAACDAVIVGGNTVRRDNPQLTTHQVTGVNPLRVVMSRNLHLPSEANLWNIDVAPTLVFTEWGKNPTLQETLRQKGVEVIELSPLSPSQVMDVLYERELSSVLWECGGVLSAEAIADGVIQKIMAFIAPKIIGGVAAASPVGNLGLEKMTDALQLKEVSFRQVDEDILIEGYVT